MSNNIGHDHLGALPSMPSDHDDGRYRVRVGGGKGYAIGYKHGKMDSSQSIPYVKWE